MTQQSRPQADNTANGYGDAGPYSYNQWAEKLYATHTGDENTAVQRALLRGVVPTFDNMLVVTTAAGDITVGTGAGFSHGSFLFNTAAVTFSPTHGVRTDYVVIVENNTNNIYNTNLQFPTVLTDYDATPALLAYTARLAILTGPAALVQTTSYWMVPLASYDIDGAGAVTNLTDLREFIDIETVVSTVALTNDEIIDALILGVEVNDGVGANDLGVGIKFRLESAAGTTEDAGQLAIRYTDSAAADETRLELRLKAGGADNLAAVINAPTAASADGNARGAGAVDLQQVRAAVTDVASGENSVICGGADNTASNTDSAICGGDSNTASGVESFIGGGADNTASAPSTTIGGGIVNTASNDYASVLGGASNIASGTYSAVLGGQNNWATTTYASAVGLDALASLRGQVVQASGYFAIRGDAQGTIQLTARCTTGGGGVAATLYLDGAAAMIIIPASSAWTYDILIIGISQNTAAQASFRAYGMIERDNANNTTLQSATGVVTEFASGAQTATVTADDANEALQIQFNDNSVAVHRVVATVRLAQVTYP